MDRVQRDSETEFSFEGLGTIHGFMAVFVRRCGMFHLVLRINSDFCDEVRWVYMVSNEY